VLPLMLLDDSDTTEDRRMATLPQRLPHQTPRCRCRRASFWPTAASPATARRGEAASITRATTRCCVAAPLSPSTL
jgi:hypothetical protein